ncbi:spermidine N1-acetyltransferase [Diaphorobacter sp.]|uniref:spermidine N1-acetyltransferase n=1 Tax=Diaphorobacter sp. TaxID=1934310 RepID=UPI0028AAEEBD|nr:spermidine N1-acetyltransferase [Diaphorobacter sp.]
MIDDIQLRPLERDDLRFVHSLNNNASVMRYWFEEPFETFDELSSLYEQHIHDQSERRFVVTDGKERVGLVELVEIDLIHRRAEIQIIIDPGSQGRGLASQSMYMALEYGFKVLNLYKVYLYVDKSNDKAVHIYTKLGFRIEGELVDEFFAGGEYRTALRMYILQTQHLALQSQSLDIEGHAKGS